MSSLSGIRRLGVAVTVLVLTCSPVPMLTCSIFCASRGKIDWRSFEPSPQGIAPYLPHFNGPPEPFVITAERILRRTA